MSIWQTLLLLGVRRVLSLRAVFTILALTLIVISAPQRSLSTDAASDRSPEMVVELAEKGDPEAQFDLGMLYYYGKG
ncbi:MAG: SEL1-like repeat protein, partial [Deltaproteobacteria bacterium]